MKRWLAIASGLAVLLAACAGKPTFYSEAQPRTKGYSLALVSAPNPTAPNVFVVGEYIVVDQEPIHPPGDREGDPITIYFALEQDGNYKFREHGIEIAHHPSFCNTVTDYVVKCAYSRPVPGTIYKYAIRVRNTVTGTNLRDLDPTIWN